MALPDAPLDPSSAREGALIRAGLPYLREAFREPPLARLPRARRARRCCPVPGGSLGLGHDAFDDRARRAPGSFLVRVHYTPYWTLAGGGGLRGQGAGRMDRGAAARRADARRVAARFSLARALGAGGSCVRAR